MSLVQDLLPLSPAALHARMANGHPLDPSALDDTEYHGVSLGLWGVVEAVAWKTFKKVFRRDPHTGVLRGWNVAVEQQGPEGPFVDRVRRGKRITYGHYEVRPGVEYVIKPALQHGVVIDYGRGRNAVWDVTGLLLDPVVSLQADSAEVLLGYTMAQVGPFQAATPSFFVLTRGGPLTYDVRPPRGRG